MRVILLVLLSFLCLRVAAQPFRELNPAGDAYHGLSFLDTLLKDKRIVLLGESSHGTEEYSQVKLS
jgi:erythromycin esterase